MKTNFICMPKETVDSIVEGEREIERKTGSCTFIYRVFLNNLRSVPERVELYLMSFSVFFFISKNLFLKIYLKWTKLN